MTAAGEAKSCIRASDGGPRRALLWAALAVVVLGFAVPPLLCNTAADLDPFASGQHPVAEANLLLSNGFEEFLILGFTVDESTEDTATLTARTWWCLPYATVDVTQQGATRK
jgi:hypothetical protein